MLQEHDKRQAPISQLGDILTFKTLAQPPHNTHDASSFWLSKSWPRRPLGCSAGCQLHAPWGSMKNSLCHLSGRSGTTQRVSHANNTQIWALPPTHATAKLLIYPSSHQPIFSSIHPSLHQPVHPSTHLFIYSPIHPSIYQTTCSPVLPSNCLPPNPSSHPAGQQTLIIYLPFMYPPISPANIY